MESFILIFFCLGSGFAIRRFSNLPEDSYKAINAWILYVAMPALSLRYISALSWNLEMLLPILGPILLWCGAWVYVRLYAKRKNLDRGTRTVMLLACGLGNTGFMGFPLVTAFFGAEALSVAAVFDMGTFMLFGTVATATVLNAAGAERGERVSPFQLAKKMLAFPAFLSFVAALILPHFISLAPVYPFLELLTATVSPLALFSIGLQLRFRDVGASMGHVFVGIFFKLIIAPSLVLILALLMGAGGQIAQVSVLQGGVAPHITASIMASQFGQNPRLAGLLVGIGILCALATTPLWWLLLNWIF